MAKRMKFERRASRQARADSALNTPSPAPEDTIAAAAQGEDINRGSSTQIPISDDVGQSQQQQTAERLARGGGVDKIIAGPSVRTQQMADAIAKNNPKPVPIRNEPGIESWPQGNLEGKPKSETSGVIRDLIRKNPRRIIPGQGAMSDTPGQSFDQWRLSTLPALRGVMQEFAEGIRKDPQHKIAVPAHSGVVRLAHAWLKNGAPDDFSINPEAMDEKGENPGGVDRMFPNKNGEWEISDTDKENPLKDGPGIYLVRHAVTPQNKENYELAAKQQGALSKMVGRVRALDFPNVNKWAKQASDAGMSDQDIEKYIDSSLPSADEASDMPLPHVAAIVAAASPAKKPEYDPILQSHFGNLQGLPPQVQQQIAAHLAAVRS